MPRLDQLLARNLGIPNVVVGKSVLGQVQRRVGNRVVLAVSPNGVVQLEDDSASWDRIFGKAAEPLLLLAAFVVERDA